MAIGIQFLKEQPYWTHYSFIPWQNYDTFKDNIGEEDEETWNPNLYPLFYAHFDLYEKTGYFWKLPDIRGEKENNYRKIGFEAKKKLENLPEEGDEAKALRSFGEALGKRYLFYDRYTRKDFVENCEDDQIKEALEMDENYLSYHLEDIDFEGAILFLSRIDEEVPMIAHDDWRTAIKESVIFFKNEAKKQGASYQAMIRRLIDFYVASQ